MIVLSALLLIGVFMEMLGLGLMLPILSIMLNKEIGTQYPALKPALEFLGNPTQTQLVIGGLIVLVCFYVFKLIFILFLNWRQARFTSRLSAEIAHKLLSGYLKMPYAFHLQRNSSQLISNIQGEVSIFSTVTQAVMTLQTEISIIIGAAAMLIFVEPVGATIVTFFLGISAVGFHRLTRKKLLSWGLKRQKYDQQINKHVIQALNGVKDVKLLGRESYFLSRFSESNYAKIAINTKQQTLLQFPRVYLELLSVIGLAGLIILMMIQKKPVEQFIPTLGIFVSAAFRMIPSLNRIMASTQSIRFAQPVVNILYDELVLIQSVPEPSNREQIDFRTNIRLHNLHFRYDSATNEALKNVSFSIPSGSTVGFIGPSGSGKSTLVDVILGLLTPSAGEVLVDNSNIQSGIRAWQDQIGYVPQSIYLTDDTIRRNIAFGIPTEQIDDASVEKALKSAQLDEYINSLPEGLETFVGERGVRLSGGQRQRIGIARALYRNPSVLVLDEATSALDTNTEKGVMQAITALKGTKTILIVAHRLSTVENCDILYRFNHGVVEAAGSPAEILNVKNA